MLVIEHEKIIYRESARGASRLIISDLELPEVMCVAFKGKSLADVVDLPTQEFGWLRRASPMVIGARNVTRRARYGSRKVKALEIRIRNEWSHEHWQLLPSAEAEGAGDRIFSFQDLSSDALRDEDPALQVHCVFDWPELISLEYEDVSLADMVAEDRPASSSACPPRFLFAAQ